MKDTFLSHFMIDVDIKDTYLSVAELSNLTKNTEVVFQA